MSTHNIHGTFVSEKINKIRWRPEFLNDSHFFLTGSWDNDENSIKLWDMQMQEVDDDIDFCPYQVAEYNQLGDVTELKFLTADAFVASSSDGSVNLMKITTEHGSEPIIECKLPWEQIHKFPSNDPSPCTCLTVYDNDIASGGEDGRINLLNAQSRQIVRTIDRADSCSINCILFLKHSEVITGNLRGQLKVWDIRTNQDEPAVSFMLSQDQVTPTCLQYHPTQRHIMVASDEEGSITIWDLRHNTYPINSLNAHSGGISEIQFHPDHPDQLFSVSSAGEILQWAPKTANSFAMSSENCVWLANDSIKTKFDIFSLMPKLHKPINCLDLNRNKVICGADNEAIYSIIGINLYNT